MPRVLHIISTSALAGTEHYLLELITNANPDLELTVICPAQGPLGEKLKSLNFPVLELDFANRSLPGTTFKIHAFIKKWQPDVVHTHLGKATLVGAPVAKMAGVAATVTTLHFIKPAYTSTYRKIYYPFFLLGHRLVNCCLNRMIAISKAVQQATMARERVPLAKIIHVPHGTAFQAQTLTLCEREQARAALKIDAHAPVVVTLARLEQEKGYDLLLKAIPQILKHYPTVQFLWIGDGALRQKLTLKVASESLAAHIHFVGFQREVAPLLALADIFLHPTPVEGFGIAILEAMASGLPVVAFNAGGPAEIVVDGVTGLLVDQQPRALAEAVNRLLSDPAKARLMGLAGQYLCRTEYTVQRMVSRTEQVYTELLAAKKGLVAGL